MDGQYFPLKNWAKDERPREKLMEKGAGALSVNELIAVILRSGVKGETAVDLARRILADCDNNLDKLAHLKVKELVNKYKGIGLAKAAGIICAVELGRRRAEEEGRNVDAICSSKEACNYVRPLLQDLEHEEFWVMYLNLAKQVLGCERLSSGGTAVATVDVKILFKNALEVKAQSIILFHNHPSGTLKPSNSDIRLTERIKKAAELLELKVDDHIIIGHKGYYSFVDSDTMP